MGTVINLREYKNTWKEVFTLDGPNSTLQVYVDKDTGEAEVVQQDDNNETIRTPFTAQDIDALITALVITYNKR